MSYHGEQTSITWKFKSMLVFHFNSEQNYKHQVLKKLVGFVKCISLVNFLTCYLKVCTWNFYWTLEYKKEMF